MPLTQTETAPGGGPTGTLLSPVLGPSPQSSAAGPSAGTVPAAPLQHPYPPPRESTRNLLVPPSGPHPQRDSLTSARRPSIVVLGVVLAVVAVAIVGAVVFVLTRPEHRHVPLIQDRPREASAPDNDDASPEPEVAPAPPLSASAPATRAPAAAPSLLPPLPTPTPTPTPTPPPSPTRRGHTPSGQP
jgi:hypothetical protein